MSTFFKFRQEELPIVGEILLQMFTRDRSAFEDFSAEYNDEFLNEVSNQIKKVNDLTQAPMLTAEIKKTTADLYECIDGVIPKLDLITAYAQRANKALNIKAADIGVKQAKKEIKKRNVEGYCAKVKVVEQNIANNLEALKARGYKEALGNELAQMTKKAYDLNLRQEEKIREKKELVSNNHIEFDKLWKFLSDISKTGKLVMKDNKQKSEDYMFTHIIKLVRKPKAAVAVKTKVVPVVEEVKEEVVAEEAVS
ncbi:hypothetical protein DWB61_01050 [Ancylomarina euxinus]|uniref:Uncharacterized protein n=1 Tax=Ancylomarina euxinus TaxID=2283627 RepID=A0A425Y826_9BACT|nr:hypothetical protein [Ancylomarina euxinus]MCZ4693499.1 hypothetical protein [Ancylomarina euxinus]MUP13726.1 hypothetical protein [Ancylomarina euxinus]RRG24636.1 hypothetical protein DWB61_01050 [Ancylomarina euxinus]